MTTSTWELPAGLVAVLIDCPEVASDMVLTVLAEAHAMANRAGTSPSAYLSIVAAWCCYQSVLCNSGDLVEDWLDRLAHTAVVMAGDALDVEMPRSESL